MKIATLICLTDGEVDGDVQTFDISTDEGKKKALLAWEQRIRNCWESDSTEEILSRIEDGVINEYSYVHNGYSFQLFFGDLE